jgi:hypothetical protein
MRDLVRNSLQWRVGPVEQNVSAVYGCFRAGGIQCFASGFVAMHGDGGKRSPEASLEHCPVRQSDRPAADSLFERRTLAFRGSRSAWASLA